MAGLSQYFLRLLTAAILLSLVLCLFRNTPYERLLRCLCGVFLTIFLMKPLRELPPEGDFGIPEQWVHEGQDYSAYGTAMAQQERKQRISQALEAYILDKAAGEGIRLTVEVTLGEDLLPESAVLQGEWEEHTRQALAESIETELGIAKENQWWTG